MLAQQGCIAMKCQQPRLRPRHDEEVEGDYSLQSTDQGQHIAMYAFTGLLSLLHPPL